MITLQKERFQHRVLRKMPKTCSIAEVISVGVFWMVEKFGMIVDV